MTLKWNEDLKDQYAQAITLGLRDFGSVHEGAAKGELRKGRGVVTGTLRRSIHAANPSYNWSSDDAPSSNSSPERSATGGDPERRGDLIVVTVGSGMTYARAIEQRYAYMKKSFDKVKERLEELINKQIKSAGLA